MTLMNEKSRSALFCEFLFQGALLIFRIFNMSSVYQVSRCVINKELQSSKSIVLECNMQIKEYCPLRKHLLCERI